MKKLLLLALLLSANGYADQSSATAKTRQQAGSRGNATTVFTWHTVHIVNNTLTAEDIPYTFTICVNYGHCERMTKTVHIEPGAAYDDTTGRVSLNELFYNAGRYAITARTEIMGSQYVEAKDYNVLVIY